MAETAKIKKIITISMVFYFLYSCANQLPPGGGPPDTVAPEIIDIYPHDQTINYNDNFIEITFSEYVNKRSVQESIFISPNIEGIIEYDWSGKSVELELPDTLRKNTTYTVTIGTDVEDINNKNKMGESFTFAFSTGEKIDKGTIAGSVFDESPSGIMIYSYKVISDTLNPTKQKPDYITQTGENGRFKLSGLSNGLYKVFAFRDQFKDYLYDPEQDQFGAPFQEISLDESDSLFTGLNFQMQIEDTTKPRVINLTMTDQYHLLVEFSEPIDSSKVTADNFYVFDSTKSTQADVKYFFKGRTKSKNYLLAISDTLNESDGYHLVTENIIDRFGNILGHESTSFVQNSNPDTVAAEMFRMETKYPANKIDFINGKIRLLFTDGFDQSDIENIFTVVDLRRNEIASTFEKIDDATIDIKFDNLSPNVDYEVYVDHNKLVDAAGNKMDSVFTHKFSTINNLDFSGLSGSVNSADKLNVVVMISNVDNSKISYKSAGKVFDFNRVYPGKYLLMAFVDKNQNEEYDYGSVLPFEAAERFVVYPDTLELKPRWPVGDVKLRFE